MSQKEIYDIMKQHKDRYFTIEELSKTLKLKKSSVSNSTSKLLQYNFIESMTTKYDKKFFRIKNKRFITMK
jgi:predicted transcriptional regulator